MTFTMKIWADGQFMVTGGISELGRPFNLVGLLPGSQTRWGAETPGTNLDRAILHLGLAVLKHTSKEFNAVWVGGTPIRRGQKNLPTITDNAVIGGQFELDDHAPIFTFECVLVAESDEAFAEVS